MTISTKQNNLTEKLFSFQLISVVLTTVFHIWTFDAFASIMVSLNFILTTLLLVNEFFKRSNKNIILWILIIFISFFASFIRVSGFNFEAFKSWLIFVSTINLFYWVSIVNVTDKIIKKFFMYSIIIVIFFIIAALDNRLYANNNFLFYVTFGLSNPNLTAIYLLNIFLALSIYMKFAKNNSTKFLCLGMIVFCGYYIYMTEARACIIAGFLYLLFYFLKTKRYSSTFNFFVILFPLIFIYIYLNYIDNPTLKDAFDFFVSDGKLLNSREYIWQESLDIIKKSPLIGNYLKGGNMHNIYLSIMVAYGNIVCVLFILFLNFITNAIGKNAKHPYQFVAFYAFYAILIAGTFEGALVSGSHGMYVFSVCLLLVAKYDINANITEEPLQSQPILGER